MNHELVYDVGMNNGADTAYYLHRGFNVVAIEADPTLCATAAVRFRREIAEGRLSLLNVGVAETAGTAEFWICEANSAWNSFHRSIASRDGLPHHSVEVPCQPFEQILERFGIPFYLKVDIEGNDLLCLGGLRKYLSASGGDDRPRYVSVEIGKIDKYLDALAPLGFGRFKLISQYNFLPLQIPPSKEARRYVFWQRMKAGKDPSARLGRWLLRNLGQQRRIAQLRDRTRRWGNWTFPFGSSGPFGEDTPGEWQALQDVRRTFNTLSAMAKQRVSSPYWGEKDYSFWVDLHATHA